MPRHVFSVGGPSSRSVRTGEWLETWSVTIVRGLAPLNTHYGTPISWASGILDRLPLNNEKNAAYSLLGYTRSSHRAAAAKSIKCSQQQTWQTWEIRVFSMGKNSFFLLLLLYTQSHSLMTCLWVIEGKMVASSTEESTDYPSWISHAVLNYIKTEPRSE